MWSEKQAMLQRQGPKPRWSYWLPLWWGQHAQFPQSWLDDQPTWFFKPLPIPLKAHWSSVVFPGKNLPEKYGDDFFPTLKKNTHIHFLSQSRPSVVKVF